MQLVIIHYFSNLQFTNREKIIRVDTISCPKLSCSSTDNLAMSSPTNQSTYPEAPAKKHNDLPIELISGSIGGALQVLVGQVT